LTFTHLVLIEVLSAMIPVGMDTLFKDAMRRFSRMSVDIRVAGIAHDLRNDSAVKGGKILKTPDSIHLATAILHRADEFHTFDDGLISLSGNVGGHRLIVCKPEARNPQLDLRHPKQNE
jgi:predicted nucleic acid-binding protein